MTQKTVREVIEKFFLPCKQDPFREFMKRDIDRALQEIKKLIKDKSLLQIERLFE